MSEQTEKAASIPNGGDTDREPDGAAEPTAACAPPEALSTELSREGVPRQYGPPGIRTKVLSLVVASALLPTVFVGTSSYVTARRILIEKVNDQLATTTGSYLAELETWIQERTEDADVFASTFLITENLARWQATEDALLKEPIEIEVKQYLEQIQDRYPLYRDLVLYDLDMRPIAFASSAGTSTVPRDGPVFEGEPEAELGAVTDSDVGVTMIIRRPIITGDGRTLGVLQTASSMAEIWEQLSRRVDSETEVLRVIDAGGTALFDSAADPLRTAAATPAGLRRWVAGEPDVVSFGKQARARALTLELCSAVARIRAARGTRRVERED